jgi:hypothetical protein
MTAPQMGNALHVVSRLSVLVISAVAAVILFHEIEPWRTENPQRAAESGAAKPDAEGPRYFHASPGDSSALIRLEDINAQIKRVAAARGVSADMVRQLVNTQDRTKQSIDVRALNQELDIRWPIK